MSIDPAPVAIKKTTSHSLTNLKKFSVGKQSKNYYSTSVAARLQIPHKKYQSGRLNRLSGHRRQQLFGTQCEMYSSNRYWNEFSRDWTLDSASVCRYSNANCRFEGTVFLICVLSGLWMAFGLFVHCLWNFCNISLKTSNK